jgi:hypothetical protein
MALASPFHLATSRIIRLTSFMANIRTILSCIFYHTLGAQEAGKSDQLITPCLTRAEQTGEKGRLRTIHDLDAAAIRRPLSKGRLRCEVGV